MQAAERHRWESEIRDLCERGEVSLAVEQAVRYFGPEIRRLMFAVLRDEARAEDAFSRFCEGLVIGLPRFRWESSFRCWAQRVARNACFKQVSAAAVRRRHVGLEALSEQPAERRSSTNPWQRSTLKERFRVLRSRLAPQDQLLLELRVDQRLSWPEVARRMGDPEEAWTSEARARRAAAVRQQFQRVKALLRAQALKEGLITCDDLTLSPA